MAGLVPAIHVFIILASTSKDVDARHKAGHDGENARVPSGIEPEMHDVAVGDDIFLAFQP